MSARRGCRRTRLVSWLTCTLLWGACARDTAVDTYDEGSANADDKGQGTDDDDVPPPSRKDAGGPKADAGKTPVGAFDAGAKPVDATGKDAAIATAPDAGSGPTASKDSGTSGASKDGGAANTADGSTPPSAGVCALKRYPLAEGQQAPVRDGFPVLEVNGGVPVEGVGCEQQWEGIVMTNGGRGLCSAAFISARHLISASHCYASDGAVSLKVSAPTWEKGASHTFQAQVKRSGTNMALDVSIIDLGKPVDWATPERRYVLHAGKASSVDLHLYGYGSSSTSGGGAGTLRGIPNRATLHVTDDGKGSLSGKAGPAQLCTGDSGGPAFVEKTAPVLYGVNQAIVPSRTGGGRTCAAADWTIIFTNVSAYLPFIEQTLGKKCERKQVDDLDVAQCW